MFYRPLAFVGIMVSGVAVSAQASVFVDQENPVSNTNNIAAFFQSGLGQEVTPSVTSLCGVRLQIQDSDGNPWTGGGNITVQVQDAPFGNVLATGVAPVSGSLWTEITWTDLAVVPEQVLFLQFTSDVAEARLGYSAGDTYARGRVAINGLLDFYAPFLDTTFQTLTSVPAPSAAGLFGVFALTAARRRRGA